MGTLRKRNKILLFVLTALCALALGLGVMSLAPERVHAEEEHTSHDGWTKITSSTESLRSGNYYLDSDVNLDAVLQLTSSSYAATLCLNGHKLTGDGSGSVIKNYGKLTICDCQSGNENYKHYYTVDESTGLYTFVTDGSTTENYIVGGVITGGNTTSSGGGIYMNGSTAELILQGGTIAGNDTKYNGGGVYAEAGKFTLNGGAIAGNRALNTEGKTPSDAVYVRYSNASFTMNGGEVAGSIGRESGKIAINGGSFDEAAYESLDDLGDKVTFADGMELVQDADGNYTLAKVHKHDDVSFTEFTTSSLNGDALPAGNYYLTEDMQQVRAIRIREEVAFCLNGKRLYGDGVSQMFIVEDGGSLTICDCQSENDEAKHYYTLGENGLYEFTDTQTENYIVGGVISDANGAVRVEEGTFILQSGTIAGNKASTGLSAAGIYAKNATVNITGGSVVGNVGAASSCNGGGVYLTQSTFTMTGGRIAENYVGQWGGGVYASASTFTMSGGFIEDNSAKLGGGVYLAKNVNYTNDAVFEMTGGTIEGNSATEAGGGVYLYSGTMNIGGMPVIKSNTVNGSANDTDGKFGLTVNAKLEEGTQIGLGTFDVVENVVTGYSDFNSEDPNEFFFTNTAGDSIVLEEGNLSIVQAYIIHYYLNSTLLGSQTALFDGDTLMTFEELNGTVAEGSKFYGWATAVGSQSISYSDGQVLTVALAAPGEEVDLYAVIAEQGLSFEEQLAAAIESLNAALEALESSASSSDEALQTAIDDVQTKLDEAVLKLEGAFAEGDEANAAALAEAVSELKTAFEAADELLASDIAELESSGEALQAALDALDEAYRAADEALAASVEELKGQLDEAVSRLEELLSEGDEANAAALAEAVSELKTAFEAADGLLASDIAELESSGEALQAALDALDEAYRAADEALAASVEELKGQLDEAVSRLEELLSEGDEANAAALAEAVSELKTAFEAADDLLASDIAELESSGEALQAALDALDEAYRAADEAVLKTIGELQTENVGLREELDGQEKELSTLNAVVWVAFAVAVLAVGVGAAGLVFGIKAGKRDNSAS